MVVSAKTREREKVYPMTLIDPSWQGDQGAKLRIPTLYRSNWMKSYRCLTGSQETCEECSHTSTSNCWAPTNDDAGSTMVVNAAGDKWSRFSFTIQITPPNSQPNASNKEEANFAYRSLALYWVNGGMTTHME